MSVRLIMWMAIGIGAGVAHVTALWRSAHALKSPGRNGAWRLPLVAVVLVAAAFDRALVPTVSGWAVGLSVASLAFLLRERRWR